jgi:signal transduction histidine kinase/CheY-like chemotaxis protein
MTWIENARAGVRTFFLDRLQNVPRPRGAARLGIPRMMRGIRGHLVMLVAVALTPVLLFAIGGVVALADRERRAIETGLRDTARSLAFGVEKELDSSITALQALTTSSLLQSGDLSTFQEQLATVRAEARASWVTAAVVDDSGRIAVSLAPPLASVFPPAADPGLFRPVFTTGRPWVSHAAARQASGASQILVAVPVARQARVESVLVAVLSGETLPGVIWRHRLAAGASVFILDATGAIVTRVSTAGAVDRTPLDGEVFTAQRAGWEGVSQFVTGAGHSMYAAYARSPERGWTAMLIVPGSTVDGSWRRWLAMVVGGGVILLLLGVALALLAARGIASPIAALARSAEALGRGASPRPLPSGIAELDEVGHAIGEAAAARRESARELEIRARQQSAVVALGQRALAGSDITTLLDDAARTLCSTLGAELCHVLELDAAGADMVLRAAVGCPRALVGRPAGPVSEDSPAGQALRTREPVVIDDLGAHPGFPGRSLREAHGVASGAIAVIHGPTGPYGLLGVYTAAARAFTGDDVNFLQSIANILATAMERMRAEAERAELLRRERIARTEAEAASRAKDEFLAMLGHELRNPLAAIASASQVLEEGRPSDEVERRPSAIIARQARHLSRIVDDLLDVSRVSSGKIALNREPVDLQDVAERAVAAFREAGRFSRHALSLSTASAVVYGDATRLQQIVWNLLDNALKYTPEGGRVNLAVMRTRGTAELCVRDTGVGVAPELLPHIFDLFVQAGRSLDRAEGGLGLGLTLVRRLVELHGGTVRASSDGPGQGSEFIVRLPILYESAEPAPSPAGVSSPSRRILLVEDNADAREALALLLESWGHRVEQAADGLTGLRDARANPPEVALIDVGLPGMDGYALAREIRAEPRCRGVRLIALTGYSRTRDRQRGHEAGFDSYLVKPVDPAHLRAELAAGGPCSDR